MLTGLVWSAVGIGIGLAPLVWAWVGCLAAMAVVLVVTHRNARLRTGCLAVALCAPALLVINYFGASFIACMRARAACAV